MARAMSQEEAATAADLSARTIQRIEAGHPASLESTKALLTIFGADIIHEPESQVPGVEASPWLLLRSRVARAMRRSASFGFDGLRLVFVVTFLLIAAAKPFMPDRTGLFVGGDGAMLGMATRQPTSSHEVLGYWITPLLAIVAIALLLSIGRFRHAAAPRLREYSSRV